MKKLLCLLFVFGAVLFTGCEKAKKILEIKLEGNPTTGYEWNCTISNDAFIELLDSGYIQDDADDAVGVGGVYTYKFKGLSEGKTIVTCTYARNWEEEPIDTKIFKVEVDKDLNIEVDD